MRILVVEDDGDIAAAIKTMLGRLHYAIDLESDGERGLDRLLCATYDAAVIDVMLPGRDGFSICRATRAANIVTPVLMLTARDAVDDRIRGLDAGADDYLVKPFAFAELAARLRALLRRAERVPQTETLTVGSLVIDGNLRVAWVAGSCLHLGTTEFRLLEMFARNRGMALSRATLLEKLWDYDFEGSSNIVDVYVSQLRRKLRRLRCTASITTVWGVGYKLVEPRSGE